MNLNEIDMAGYKLLGNKEYVDGDMVWFENGLAGKAILDGSYTGWLTIKEFNNSLYGTVDINDVITVPAATNEIIVKVKQSFVKEYGANTIVNSINTCTDVVFNVGKNNYVMEIARPNGKKAMVPYDLSPEFFNMFKDLTGKITKVSKNTVATEKGDTIDSVYVSINLDTIPASVAPMNTIPSIEEDPLAFEMEESDAI